MSINANNLATLNLTVATDSTKLPLAGGSLSGTLYTPAVRNLLNQNLSVVAYNDTGAGTTYTHSFNPFNGTLNLATNGGGLVFPDASTQVTAFLPANPSFTGKINVTTSSTVSSLNIGSGKTPSSSVAGDIWVSTSSLRYKDAGGTERLVADTNRSQVFSSTQTIQTTNNTNPALRITQLGTGEALRVEDEANPDTTSFVVSNSGRVGIGIDPDSTVALKVDATGISFNGIVFNTTGIQNEVLGRSYTKELVITVDGVNYVLPASIV
jgi:hypothetical protein